MVDQTDPQTDPRATGRIPWTTVQLSALELRKQAATVSDGAPPTGQAYRALAYALANLCSALAGYYAPARFDRATEERLAALEVDTERLTDVSRANSAISRLALLVAILALLAALWR